MTGRREPIDIAAVRAAEWHVRLQSEDAGEKDWLAFERWLAAPRNKAAYQAIEVVLADVEDHREALGRALRGDAPQGEPEPLTYRFDRKRGRPSIAVWAGAAAATVLTALIGLQLASQSSRTVEYAASATASRLITLPDSSTVQLNRGAIIRVGWGRERRVTLERGEAAFRIVHDPSRPLVVAVGPDEIRDIGTELDVLRTASRLVVTVREGEVEVRTPLAAPLRVSGGYEARIDHSTRQVARAQVDADAALAWREGRLVYRDANLDKVVEDLNRYSDRPITIADPAAGALRFTGVLVIDDASMMTERLATFLPLRVEHADGEIMLRSKQ
jgi:transmembrane sensor